MTKKLQKLLITESYLSDGSLNGEVVSYIAEKLSRSDLKTYITALKEFGKKSTVVIKSASELSVIEKKSLQSLYFGKKLDFVVDPSLLLGMEIIDYDMVYTKNLKNTFHELLVHVENYD